MAQTFDLGHAVFVNKGAYNSTTVYAPLNTVYYRGGTWVALQGVSGVEPGTDGTKWLCITNGVSGLQVAAGTGGALVVTFLLTDGTSAGPVTIPAVTVADGSITTEKLAAGGVTAPKLAADAVRLRFTNVSVAAASFVSDATYQDYPYRAAVALTGATATMRPDVCFGLTDAASGIFAPVADSYAGGVYLYATEQPSAAITIPVIDLWR